MRRVARKDVYPSLNHTGVASKSGPDYPTPNSSFALSHDQIWFNDWQSIVGYLDKAESGLGSRFLDARARMQALAIRPRTRVRPMRGPGNSAWGNLGLIYWLRQYDQRLG